MEASVKRIRNFFCINRVQISCENRRKIKTSTLIQTISSFLLASLLTACGNGDVATTAPNQ
ncbi:hypothetical protein MNBD_GAMMA07-451, partial [hydrothermal vent metagenome]